MHTKWYIQKIPTIANTPTNVSITKVQSISTLCFRDVSSILGQGLRNSALFGNQ